MDTILKEITALPGVLGSFIYSHEFEIAASKMPAIFKENAIKIIGSQLLQTIQSGKTSDFDLAGMEIKYDESLIIGKTIDDNTVLVTICEPTVNKSLIAMTSGMLVADIQSALENFVPTVKTPTGTPSQTKKPEIKTPKKEATIDSSLAPILEEIKDVLAHVVGPIAGPILKDSIEIWAQKSETTKDKLPELAEIICAELNDLSMIKEFMKMARKFL